MKLNRQHFLKAGAAASVGFPAIVRAQGLNEKLQVGFVAVGGRAKKHTQESHQAGLQCTAFADVDKRTWGGVLDKEGWSDAAGYTDWREMFTKHRGEIDAVFVSTPDHSHFSPTMTALNMGIHCYTEKPLTWSVREAQLLTKAYEEKPDVVTQMGNHGHAMQGWRVAYELVKGGAVGDVKEFHTWTNRPKWPQGGRRPKGSDPVPDYLDWNMWIGPAPMRPYVGAGPGINVSKGHGTYHRFCWRGFVDFGAGALGDMACHTTDGIYAIMNPGYAAAAEPLKMTAPVRDQFPAGMVVRNLYRATKDRPGFAAYWYEGKDKSGKPLTPKTPRQLKTDDRELPETGNLIVGTDGMMLIEGDYWNSPRIIPEKKRREFGRPEQLLERSPGHHAEFFMACRGEKPRGFCGSNFSYAGPMTANIQLGNLCARAGKKLKLNEAGVIISDQKMNKLAWREPRKGWGPLSV